MLSTSSKVALAIGITLSVAAISAIFVTMVSAQNLARSSSSDGSQSVSQQQQSSQPQSPTSSSGGGGNNTTATSTIIIPVGAVNQNVQHYEPNPATVAPNSRVTWDNQDSAPHTATATDGSFDTGIIQAGASGSATVSAQGTISYQCTIHPWMTATLQVSSSSSASAPPTGGPSSLPSAQQQNGTSTKQQPQQQQQVGNQTAQNGTATTVDAGGGGPESVLTSFTPQEVTINAGETVVWKNPTVVGEPHTVTFIKGQGYFAAEESPYLIANGTKLTPANPEENNTAPRIIPSQNDTANNIIYVENARLTDSVVIDAQNNVEYLPLNANYTMTGDELYVNSGLIWPEGQAAPGDPPIISFNVTFEKAGTYDYVCLIHPWMGGEVAVK